MWADLAGYPRVRALVWFNERRETDWRIESSPAMRAALTAPATVTPTATLTATPTPTPTSTPLPTSTPRPRRRWLSR